MSISLLIAGRWAEGEDARVTYALNKIGHPANKATPPSPRTGFATDPLSKPTSATETGSVAEPTQHHHYLEFSPTLLRVATSSLILPQLQYGDGRSPAELERV